MLSDPYYYVTCCINHMYTERLQRDSIDSTIVISKTKGPKRETHRLFLVAIAAIVFSKIGHT